MSENRSFGWLLTIGALMVVAAIAAYVTQYGAPEGTGAEGAVLSADRVRHYLAHADLLKTIWLVECAGVVLMFIAGSFVQNGGTSPGWRLARGGFTLLFVEYGLMLYGYPAASEENPALFALVNELAWVFFVFGNGLMALGFAAVFFLTPKGTALPRWLMRIAGGLALVGGLAALAGLHGTATAGTLFSVSGPLTALATLFMAAYGIGLARRR